MEMIPREVVSEISRVLSSMRSSLDFYISSSREGSEASLWHKEIREAYFQFESLRLDFRSRTQRSSRSHFANADAVDELKMGLSRFYDTVKVPGLFERVKLRTSPFPPRSSRPTELHPALYERQLSLPDAIGYLIESLDHLHFHDQFTLEEVDPPQPAFDGAAIHRVVPKEQNPAPLTFDIVDEKLKLVPQKPTLLEEDGGNAQSAKETLIESGSAILNELERSNCDRRLFENIKDLQKQLEAETDIIRLGLANIGADIMCGTFAAELPDAVSAMLKAHNVGISMYVSQFIEWQKFTEKAALTEIGSDDVAAIHQATAKVIAELNAQPDLADPEVPKSLAALNLMIADPRGSSKRAAFAVLRSMENLVIKVFNHGADFLGRTVEKSIEKGSSLAASAVIALMTIGLAGAMGLLPIAAHLSNSSWISKAIDVVQRQMGKIE
jgi:hypothetical protein